MLRVFVDDITALLTVKNKVVSVAKKAMEKKLIKSPQTVSQ